MPRLQDAGPAEWFERRLPTIFGGARPDRAGRTTEQVADRAVPMVVAALLADGYPAPAAGTYAAGWLAASPGYLVGALYAETGAALVLDARTLRWWLHEEGWTEGLAVGGVPAIAVAAGHPWRGRPGVRTLDTDGLVAQACMAALVGTVTPIVERLQRLTRAGRTGLWHEVSDAVGGSLVERPEPPTPVELERLRALLGVPRAPWKRLPRTELVATAEGAVCVCHRGGCCQSFTAVPSTAEITTADDDHSAFAAAFPDPADVPDYCANCRFRSFDDVVRRRLWWRARQAAR